MFHTLYYVTAESYMALRSLVTPSLCVRGWLLGRAAAKRLQSYIYWFLPSLIGTSISAVGLLLEAFLTHFARRDYALATAIYFLYFAGVPFHLVSFARLWKTITGLPPSSGEQPPQTVSPEQDESVWPPHPRH
jgi:hypothetical protein